MHAVNNVLTFFVVLMFGGWQDAFVGEDTDGLPAHAGDRVERSTGLALALILWQAKRAGIERLSTRTTQPAQAVASAHRTPGRATRRCRDPVLTLDAPACRDLTATLAGARLHRRCGRRRASARQRIGRWPATARSPPRVHSGHRDDPLATLTCLWLLQKSVPRGPVEAALPGLVAPMVRAGLLTERRGRA